MTTPEDPNLRQRIANLFKKRRRERGIPGLHGTNVDPKKPQNQPRS